MLLTQNFDYLSELVSHFSRLAYADFVGNEKQVSFLQNYEKFKKPLVKVTRKCV